MSRLKTLIKFIFSNFGPLLIFYVFNHFYGLKVAVVSSVVWTGGEILAHRIQGKSTSPFFKFTAGITILFGILDLFLQRTVFFKYEAAVSNILTGVYFGWTLLAKKPLIQEFAEAQGRIKTAPDADTVYLFRFLTTIWSLYFFFKAGFYAWVASRFEIEEGLAIRGTVGTVSFYALLMISIFGAKHIKYFLILFRKALQRGDFSNVEDRH